MHDYDIVVEEVKKGGNIMIVLRWKTIASRREVRSVGCELPMCLNCGTLREVQKVIMGAIV